VQALLWPLLEAGFEFASVKPQQCSESVQQLVSAVIDKKIFVLYTAQRGVHAQASFMQLAD
jgi:hypothetical protein